MLMCVSVKNKSNFFSKRKSERSKGQLMHAFKNAKKNAEIEMTNSNILNKCTKIGKIY